MGAAEAEDDGPEAGVGDFPGAEDAEVGAERLWAPEAADGGEAGGGEALLGAAGDVAEPAAGDEAVEGVEGLDGADEEEEVADSSLAVAVLLGDARRHTSSATATSMVGG